ncbi:TRAP transporter large permease subunit [Pseudoruegeria sp. SK021]|uniref:TRAP transporter large permease n=1 Tax=Pseudoruegeria sp. SK021 TaxID=1933035 RepID=UPI000A215D55|nr:TRAP transporter large permease subunit [Pseudoruegeria sp. SK021]OSP54133.1 C4-dicarboxylate ABC transporter [Pseudoruegeria sp. SK021]
MLELIAHNLAPIMFATVMGMLLIGYPVALTLAAGGLFFFVVGVALSEIAPSQINLFWPLLGAQPERVFGIMSNDTLLAIPFFTFMGLILERSGMAEDLLETIGQLFGPIRGGLAYAVIFVGALLAATTGVVAASVIAMGLISLPIMQRFGYAQSAATGTIVAAGTLAQIVPPSLVLIVMADQLGVSVGDMYLGAIFPSLMLVAFYCLYIFFLSWVRPDMVPALPESERTLGKGIRSLLASFVAALAIYFVGAHWIFAEMTPATGVVAAAVTAVLLPFLFAVANRVFGLNILSHLAEQVIIVLIPPLALIFLVLGTIFLGIATPTEGGAMGAVGALLLALAKKRLSFTILRSSLEATTKLSAFVMFILIGARVFGLTFYGVNGNVWLEELLLKLPGGEYGFLAVVTIVVFILGCFLDFFEIAFILVPLLAPVATTLGIDLIWFGVILGINLQTSFLTPPFGFSLFYLRSVAPAREWHDESTGRRMPAIRTSEIYKGAVPFIFINALMIALVISFPYLVTHYKSAPVTTAPSSFQLQAPAGGGLGQIPMGGLGSGGADNGGGLGLPPLGGFGAPSGGSAPSGNDGGLGLPPLGGGTGGPPAGLGGADTGNGGGLGGTAPETHDLSQPPSFN